MRLTLAVTALAAAFTNNPLILDLRFHGVVKSLRPGVDIAALHIDNLADADIQITGTRKIGKETLPVVSIRYPKAGKPGGSATIVLAGMRGRVNHLSLDLAVTMPSQAHKKLTLLQVEPGRLDLTADGISGAQSTGFTDPIPVTVQTVHITNDETVLEARPRPGERPREEGRLRMEVKNLAFAAITMPFQGENNGIELRAAMAMPNATTWSYDLRYGHMAWHAGLLEVKDVKLQPVPGPRNINFGGMTAQVNKISIDKIELTPKENPDGIPTATATISGFQMDASTLNYQNATLEGRLTRPIAIQRIDADIRIKNVFEGMNMDRGLVQGLDLGLADMHFRDPKPNSTLEFRGQSLDLSVSRYATSLSADGKHEDTDVAASVALRGADVKQRDGGRALIKELTANLRGPTDKLAGKGHLEAAISDVTTQIEVDPRTVVSNLDCSDTVKAVLKQQGAPTEISADVLVFDGAPFATGRAKGPITFTVEPKYWNCEWNQKAFDLSIPSPLLAISMSNPISDVAKKVLEGLHMSVPDVHIPVGASALSMPIMVHWRATLNPIGGVIGTLLRADIHFDQNGAKLCGGHMLAAGPGLWTPSVGPSFNDCDSVLCKIPRDILSGAFTLGESPIGALLNMAMLGAINTVGLFDAGILAGQCN